MTDTLAIWLDQRAALKAQAAQTTEDLAVVEDRIRELMGDVEVADAGRWHITYRPVETTRVDTRKVRALLPPELLEVVQTVTVSRVLRVTEAKP